MNRKMKLWALFLLSSILLGCSVEGKNDYGSYYQKQESLNVLKMPSGVSAQGADNYYVVPAGPMADVKTISILPPGSRAYQSAVAKQNAKTTATTPAPAVATTAPAVASTPAVINDNSPDKTVGADKQ
jgi:uncharacterized lipoprotein